MFLAGVVVASLSLLLISGIAALAVFSVQSSKKADRLQTQLNTQATKTAEEFADVSADVKQKRAESVSDVSALQAEFNRKLAEKEETINQQASTVVAVQTQAANLQKEMQAQSANLQKDLDQKSEELEATQNKVRENTSAIGRINDSVFDATTLYQRAQQAVVLITTPGGQGSGFLIGEKKDRIVTAFHVAESMTSWDANITASNGIKTRARLEKKDEESDLAILELAIPLVELEPLELEYRQGLTAGEPVVAIGNPYGLEASLVTGIISNPARAMGGAVCGSRCPPFIQLDMSTNGGGSGGPLLNREGKVIGVISQAQNNTIGFAIPAGRIAALVQTPALPSPSEQRSQIQIDFVGVTLPTAGDFQSPRRNYTVWSQSFTVSGSEHPLELYNIQLKKYGTLPAEAFDQFSVEVDSQATIYLGRASFSGDRVFLATPPNYKFGPGMHTITVRADIAKSSGEFSFSVEDSTDLAFAVKNTVTREGRIVFVGLSISVNSTPFKPLRTGTQIVR